MTNIGKIFCIISSSLPKQWLLVNAKGFFLILKPITATAGIITQLLVLLVGVKLFITTVRILRNTAPRYESGETHCYQGRPYRLRLVLRNVRPRVTIRGASTIEMAVPFGADPFARERALTEWYRARLREAMPALVAKWEAVVGVHVAEWRVKRMRTRWGSCNPQARRIWVNLELAKLPVHCLEYVIVHEMVHMLERRHDARFYAFMDAFHPGWREVRKELKQAVPG